MGLGWVRALLLSIVVSIIFAQIFSSLVGMEFWIGFAIFLMALLAFMGVVVYSGRGRDAENERIRQLAAFRSLQEADLRDDEI